MTFERKVVLSQKPDPYEVSHQQIRYGNFITIHHLSNCTGKDICIVLIWNTSTKGFSSLTLSITSICCSTVARTSFITMLNFFPLLKTVDTPSQIGIKQLEYVHSVTEPTWDDQVLVMWIALPPHFSFPDTATGCTHLSLTC